MRRRKGVARQPSPGRAPKMQRGPDLPARYRRIYDAVARVPEGTVVTYGQIADMVGVGAREVGRALRLLPEGLQCPWHRVVNARGEVSVRSGSGTAHKRQERLLAREGIVFESGRIDLDVYRWQPMPDG